MAAVGSSAMGKTTESVFQNLPSYGVILGNTGGDWVKNNPKETLKQIAAWGYKDIEGGNDYGMGIEGCRDFMLDLGLNPFTCGLSMNDMNDHKKLAESLAKGKRWRAEYAILYWPFNGAKYKFTIEEWDSIIAKLNEAGRICREEGMKLLYHNHDFEMDLTGDWIPYDYMLQNTDPELVNFEIDLYWVTKGGMDPIYFLKKYANRFPVMHVKDMDRTAERDFAIAGQGIIDFAEIFAYSKLAGTQHFILEHDKPKDNRVCIEAGGKFLRNIKYALK